MNVLRAVSSEGFGRIRYHTTIRQLLESDSTVRGFWEGESTKLPKFYEDQIRKDLGLLWETLPAGTLMHNQNVYLNSSPATGWVDIPLKSQMAN